MLNKLSIFAIGAALANVASAIGQAHVVNQCAFPVTAWSVGTDISAPTTLQTGATYSETFTRDPNTGGRAIKITRDPNGLFNGSPQTIFAYNLKDSTIWYDLSDVFGDPFSGNKLVATAQGCGNIVWQDGIPPAGSQVKNCDANKNVNLVLCAE